MNTSPFGLLLLFNDGAFDGGSDLGWGLLILVLAVIIIGALVGLLFFITGPRRRRQGFTTTESQRTDATAPQRTKADNGTRVLVVIILLSLFCLCMGLFSH